MLQHVYRTENFSKHGSFVKCFLDTETVLTLHNHFPISCLTRSCTSYPIETSDAQLHHYRTDCGQSVNCSTLKQNVIMDNNVWKFKDKLIQRVTNTLNKLKYFSNINE